MHYSILKQKRVEALSDVNISIKKGEQIAVIGPSGCGKTTFLKSLVFAIRPTYGKLLFHNVDPWLISQKRRHMMRSKIFISLQVPHLPPRQKVHAAVYAGKLAGVNSLVSIFSLIYPQDIEQVKYALDCFGLADKIHERVDRLSGGERQRIFLARAVVSKSELWAVDEPLASLDPIRAEGSILSLKKIAFKRNLTFVTSLHQTEIALKHFSRVIGIKQGKIFFDQSPTTISDELIKNLYRTDSELN